MGNVLEMHNITRTFPGIIANDNISLNLRQNEVHAILGENGAGKSTLMSVLYGIYPPDSGSIILNGKEVVISGPDHANKLGIGMVHQHFKLVKNFTVTENIILGMEQTNRGVVDKKQSRKKIAELSEKYNLKVDPDAYISDITVGMQQRVEILKVLYRDADILIFDEPTAVLTPQQIKDLLIIIETFRATGKSILLITHKLEEIMSASNRCTVLRLGRLIGTVNTKDTSESALSKMMVGREIDTSLKRAEQAPGKVVLSVNKLTMSDPFKPKNILDNISFNVCSGEIVCIAGIDGNGQSELIYALTGIMGKYQGSIHLNDVDISRKSIRKRTMSGISHIPEDRQKYGLILDFPLDYNLALQEYFTEKYQSRGIIDFSKVEKNACQLIENYDIRTSQGSSTKVRGMSGGNQQKAILAREISRNFDLMIAVQPTRGLDVGAIEFIHKKLIAMRDAGKAVLVCSLELDEVMNLSDRILVMFEGRIVANLNPKKISVEELGLYMSGARKEENIEENIK